MQQEQRTVCLVLLRTETGIYPAKTKSIPSAAVI